MKFPDHILVPQRMNAFYIDNSDNDESANIDFFFNAYSSENKLVSALWWSKCVMVSLLLNYFKRIKDGVWSVVMIG